MDQRRALFRSKVREAQKREKRIDSPLVRYNENDQPVCRVCNIVLKSESNWPAHQVSRKHHEAIENLKATAGGLPRENNLGSEPPKVSQTRSSSTLPADFFDGQGAKRQKTNTVLGGTTQSVITPAGSSFSYKQGKKDLSPVSQPLNAPESLNIRSEKVVVSEETSVSKLSTKLDQPSKMMGGTDGQQDMGVLPNNFFDNNERTDDQPLKQIEDKSNLQLKKVNKTLDSSNQTSQASKKIDGSDTKQVKGALPEGFFDNKDADLRARGIEPVKVDINDAYKEFEKEIQGNLQEVDDRLEEEEIDAADEMEEFRSLEQKAYKEKVDEIKKKLIEAKAERLARLQQPPTFLGKESSDESSSDEEGDDDDTSNFAVDWRAQHL
ncbi:protein ABA AND ROS SENSITIVE 1 [Musa acuminata AAA Group]|uniref:protein ABA AND ROS SENSITIVE 1 n=1 Tax=Musa acuminata AAA Group TaxID=214697 RepID=UPI0031DCDF4E